MIRRIGKYLISGLIILGAGLIGTAYLIYPAEFVNRVLRWGDSDVYDYQKFPGRELLPSGNPFEFAVDLDAENVRGRFEEISGVADFDEFLSKQRTQAFLVIRDDTILYEQYFNGADRGSIVTSFSAAKSFASTLIGLAISDGDIHSVNDPITDYLPELTEQDPDFTRITIRDLLMMSSGIRYREPPDDATTYYFPDLRQLALENTSIVGQPGDTFHYNNFHPLLLGMILERATGITVTDYLQAKIWTPIGMAYPGSWSLDENGFEKMESGINARAVDFAKFGRLFLNRGNWNGVQVVPEGWVSEATQADGLVDYKTYYGDDFIFSDGRGYYRYMWWGLQKDAGNYDFMALGNHGQLIYISPAENLLILRFGESYGKFGGAQGWVDLFEAFASAVP